MPKQEFVETLYNLRLQYSKDHPMNYTAKLLLNSLYGRFGMRYIFDIINIISSDEFVSLSQIEKFYNLVIKNVTKLDDKFMIQYQNEIEPDILWLPQKKRF